MCNGAVEEGGGKRWGMDLTGELSLGRQFRAVGGGPTDWLTLRRPFEFPSRAADSRLLSYTKLLQLLPQGN